MIGEYGPRNKLSTPCQESDITKQAFPHDLAFRSLFSATNVMTNVLIKARIAEKMSWQTSTHLHWDDKRISIELFRRTIPFAKVVSLCLGELVMERSGASTRCANRE